MPQQHTQNYSKIVFLESGFDKKYFLRKLNTFNIDCIILHLFQIYNWKRRGRVHSTLLKETEKGIGTASSNHPLVLLYHYTAKMNRDDRDVPTWCIAWLLIYMYHVSIIFLNSNSNFSWTIKWHILSHLIYKIPLILYIFFHRAV